MQSFEPYLVCQKHNTKIDVYCKNPDCNVETRICCYICAKEYHHHETTRIYELQDVFSEAIRVLSIVEQKFKDLISKINKQAEAIRQQINQNISYLNSILQQSEMQSLTHLINALKISTTSLLPKIEQKIAQTMEKQPNLDLSMTNSQKTSHYIKLLEENKMDEAKQILQELIKLDKYNEIYKREMNNINSEPQPKENDEPDIKLFILQYEQYLKEDKNEIEALKILDEILKIDQENYIYKRERSRLSHETVEYSTADDQFQSGQYIASLIEYDKLIKIRQDSRIVYQKGKQSNIISGLSLFYLRQYEEALKCIDYSIEQDNENFQYRITRAQLLFALKDIENLKLQAISLKGFYDSINSVIEGQILMLQNEYKEAEECFNSAISKELGLYEAHFLKALCLSKHFSFTSDLQQKLKRFQSDYHLDGQKFNKFYYMYLEDYNNQFRMTPENQQRYDKIINQQNQKNEQPISKIGL